MNCGIIIVLYHPDIEHIQDIVDQFSASNFPVILVDNSPTKTQITCPGACEYLHFPRNVGIAEAQNIGLNTLFSAQIAHAILLDQDSHITVTMAKDLIAQFHTLEKTYKIAALGPSIYCQFNQTVTVGKLQRGQKVSDNVKEVKQIIASGMLLSKFAFNEVGEKESGLFIDGVDHEWCWRAGRLGFKIFQSLSVRMPHRQGDDRVKVCGITFKQGAPVRLYYQMRNLLLLSRRNYVPFYWKCRHVTAIPLRYLVNRFVFPQGRERSAFFLKGLRHGARAISGSIEDNH